MPKYCASCGTELPQGAQFCQVDCGGSEPLIKTVDVNDGEGYVPAASSGDYAYDIGVQAVATGDLTGDGRPEAAVQLICVWEGSDTSPKEIQVLTEGSDRPRLLARLRPPPASNPDTYPPRFSGFPYGGEPILQISSGQLVTGVDYWSASDPRLVPSIHRTLTWQWDGTEFTAQQEEGSSGGQESGDGRAAAEQAVEDFYASAAEGDYGRASDVKGAAESPPVRSGDPSSTPR